jgi:uncharacterized protein (UPF0335 family)
MEAINTKLFTLNELKRKSYSNLFQFVEGLKEIGTELEVEIETIEMVEDETGAINNDMLEVLNHLTTQLDYISRNISTAIKAMELCEDKVFVEVNDMMICQN